MVGDIAALQDGTGSLSVFTNEQGGIIDDTVITKVGSIGYHVLGPFAQALWRHWQPQRFEHPTGRHHRRHCYHQGGAWAIGVDAKTLEASTVSL